MLSRGNFIQMEITYQITEQDCRATIAWRLLRGWVFRICVIWMAGIFLLTLINYLSHPGHPAANFPVFAIVVLWAVFIWANFRWQARSQFRSQPIYQNAITLKADSDGICRSSLGFNSSISWQNLYRWTEVQKYFLVFTSPAQWHIIPKRCLSTEEIAEFRSVLDNNLKKLK